MGAQVVLTATFRAIEAALQVFRPGAQFASNCLPCGGMDIQWQPERGVQNGDAASPCI